MAHGAPDYSNVRKSGLTFRLDDMGELAARLGSLATYDRRGDIIWFYDFSFGKGDIGYGTVGANSATALSRLLWEKPPFSVKLTAGDSIDDYARLERRQSIPDNPIIGFQASIRASSDVSQVYINIWHYDGSSLWESWAVIDLDANTLSILKSDGTEVVIDNAIPDLTQGYYFFHLKMVVNFTTHKWVRVLFDENSYDVSDYGMKEVSSALAPHLYVKVTNWSQNTSVSVINVDNLIITTNE